MQNIRESSKEGITDMELAFLLDRQRAELDHQVEVQRKLLDVNTLFHGVCAVCVGYTSNLCVFGLAFAYILTIVLGGLY